MWTDQQIAGGIAILLPVVVAIALPLLTLQRLGSRDHRRDERWDTNTLVIAHGLIGFVSLTGAVGCALGAIGGYPLLWGPAALSAGMLASAIISAVVMSGRRVRRNSRRASVRR